MRLLTPSPQKRLSTRQLASAAENIAAAQFSMCGFDVLEHGSQTRYLSGLAVANATGMLRVTVHGSFRGFWNLVDPFLAKPAGRTAGECHRAINLWLDRHAMNIAYCLVQFEASDLSTMPRLYLATPAEIAGRLHASVDMLGDTALYEEFEIEDSSGHHMVETLPARWRFSQDRIAEVMETPLSKEPVEFRFSDAAMCAVCAELKPAACVHCLPMMN